MPTRRGTGVNMKNLIQVILLFIVASSVFAGRRIRVHGNNNEMLLHFGIHASLKELHHKNRSIDSLRWSVVESSHSRAVYFTVEGQPVCQQMLRIHENPHVIMGEWPQASMLAREEWDLFADIQERLENQGLTVVSNQTMGRRCWFEKGDSFYPVWEIRVLDQGQPWVYWSDWQNDYRKQKKYFTVVDATLRVLTKGLLVGETEDVKARISGNGYLETERIFTLTGNVEKAQSDNHTFQYETTDSRIAETTSFWGVYQTLEWAKSLGYEWHKKDTRLELRLHEDISIGGTTYKNQAIYYPEDPKGGVNSVIQIADGDESLLNLPYEVDVASHEMGHHIVYQYLKSTSQVEAKGQTENLDHSGAIHEALADYFHSSRVNDPCFAASICPAEGSSGLCYVRGKCLRSLKNSIEYDSDLYWSLPGSHLRGQLISGWLWDVRSHPEVDEKEWDQTVYTAIEYLPEKSIYTDFLVALAAADIRHFEGKHLCLLTEYASSRGLSKIVQQEIPDCTSYKSKILEQQANVRTANDGDGKVKTRYCGVVGEFSGDVLPWWWMFLPCFFMMKALFVGTLCRRGKCEVLDIGSRPRNYRNNSFSRRI